MVPLLLCTFAFVFSQTYVFPLLLVPPQIVPFAFDEETTNSGDIATVNCAVSKGDIPLKIRWSFNGKPIQTLDGITVVQMSKRLNTLSIDSVEAMHAGKYICTVENKAGTSSHSAVLNVNGTCSRFLKTFLFSSSFIFLCSL